MTKFKHLTRGFSVVEAIVSVAIIVGIVLAVFTVFGKLVSISNNSLRTLQAASLLAEGAEVVRLWRDDAWGNVADLSIDTPYYYDFSSGVWEVSNTNQYIDGQFERSFIVGEVYRDADDDIAAVGNTLDPETKLVTVSVAWLQNAATTTKTVSFYLTKIF